MLVIPWFLAIIGRAGDAFFAESVGQDMLAKVFSGQESRRAARLLFRPVLAGVLAGLHAGGLGRRRSGARGKEPATKFLLAWLVPSWLVFELVVTKLPHYVLPLYPAIAIPVAGVVDRGALSRRPFLVLGTIWWFVLPMAAGIAGIVALAVIGRQFGLLVWPVTGAAAVMGFLAWRLYAADGAEHSLLRAIAAAILTAIAIFGLIVPRSPAVSESRARPRPARQRLRAALGSRGRIPGAEPRLPGRHRHPPHRHRRRRRIPARGECRFALVEARQERGFAQRAEALGLRYTAGPRVEAINISNGQPITIAVYRSVGPS